MLRMHVFSTCARDHASGEGVVQTKGIACMVRGKLSHRNVPSGGKSIRIWCSFSFFLQLSLRRRSIDQLRRHAGQPGDLQTFPTSQDAASPAHTESHFFFFPLLKIGVADIAASGVTFLFTVSGNFSCRTATSLSPSNPTTSAAYSSPSVSVTCNYDQN